MGLARRAQGATSKAALAVQAPCGWSAGRTQTIKWILAVQDHAEEPIMDRQPLAMVIDEAKAP